MAATSGPRLNSSLDCTTRPYETSFHPPEDDWRPVLNLCNGTVEPLDLVPSLDEICSHGTAHVAEADEADFNHLKFLADYDALAPAGPHGTVKCADGAPRQSKLVAAAGDMAVTVS
jgi:hypothetical protein